jgi:hypothetical protein
MIPTATYGRSTTEQVTELGGHRLLAATVTRAPASCRFAAIRSEAWSSADVLAASISSLVT